MHLPNKICYYAMHAYKIFAHYTLYINQCITLIWQSALWYQGHIEFYGQGCIQLYATNTTGEIQSWCPVLHHCYVHWYSSSSTVVKKTALIGSSLEGMATPKKKPFPENLILVDVKFCNGYIYKH